MKVIYCKLIATEEEKTKYKTWKFIEWDDNPNKQGWNKLDVPDEFRIPSENYQEALEWLMISNDEDLIFLDKEHKAFNSYYLKTLDEITNAQRYNKKLKKQ